MGSKAYKGKNLQKSTPTTALVNNLLNNVLPGVSGNLDIKTVGGSDPNDLLAQKRNSKFKDIKRKKHAVQLINDSLKKRAFLDNIEEEKIIKKQKQRLRRSIRENSLKTKQLISEANLENLKRHYKEGNLTAKEQSILNKSIKKEVLKLKQWDLDYDVKEDLKELQNDILMVTDSKYAESVKRRQMKKSKRMSSSKRGNASSSTTDVKVSGLTPGLAPVDMEDSDSEENDFSGNELPIPFDE